MWRESGQKRNQPTTKKVNKRSSPFSPNLLVSALLEKILKNVVSLGKTKVAKSRLKKLKKCTEKRAKVAEKEDKKIKKEKKKSKKEQREKRKHHKVIKCNQCEYSSIESNELKRHKRIHHWGKRKTTINPKMCNMCDFTGTNMKEHIMRNHTGEKPIKCYQCDYSCVTSSHLRDHMRTHTGERPFKCNKCEKAFKHKNVLVKHSKTHLTAGWGIFGGVIVEATSITT